MPVTYEVRNGGTFVHTKAHGEVTEHDLLEYQAAVLADPRIEPGYYELFDATTAQAVGVSEATLETMSEMDKKHVEKLAGGKCALVVRSGFELAKRFESLRDRPHAVMVFFNLDVARAWLGEAAAET
ncbi:MAG: hypothetical protein JW741_17665 [Sedimentisphaerales bacterium]|nr:hypothetical protein [Sedimentisphaerales bacterium]